ncbi:uncharacterized protein LODBEIA_P03410 [Lodderomyces beijingensis]|uniref:Rrn9 domain-containing protein n=1 Tax=Lodderomyces beijingensis TaxID=1775926 RepID=A0ABP0ZD65_9ASCO
MQDPPGPMERIKSKLQSIIRKDRKRVFAPIPFHLPPLRHNTRTLMQRITKRDDSTSNANTSEYQYLHRGMRSSRFLFKDTSSSDFDAKDLNSFTSPADSPDFHVSPEGRWFYAAADCKFAEPDDNAYGDGNEQSEELQQQGEDYQGETVVRKESEVIDNAGYSLVDLCVLLTTEIDKLSSKADKAATISGAGPSARQVQDDDTVQYATMANLQNSKKWDPHYHVNSYPSLSEWSQYNSCDLPQFARQQKTKRQIRVVKRRKKIVFRNAGSNSAEEEDDDILKC